MSVFTEAETAYLASQRMARLATASPTGQPDVAAVTFGIDGDMIVSGGFDITKTVRYGYLQRNPRAVIVIDDLASVDPWSPRGVKVRGTATLEDAAGGMRIRIVPEVIWSWASTWMPRSGSWASSGATSPLRDDRVLVDAA